MLRCTSLLTPSDFTSIGYLRRRWADELPAQGRCRFLLLLARIRSIMRDVQSSLLDIRRNECMRVHAAPLCSGISKPRLAVC